MKEWARAVLGQNDPLTCEACEARLGEYVGASVLGLEPLLEAAAIEGHLQVCPRCAHAYHELVDLTTTMYQTALPAPPQPAVFDLSFLRSNTASTLAAAPTSQPLWQELAGTVRRLAVEIPVLVGQAVAMFGPLPPPLALQRVPLAASRRFRAETGSDSEAEFVEVLALAQTEANTEIRLSLGPVLDSKGTLVVQVNSLAPSLPQPQVMVTLLDPKQTWLEGAPTDPDGLVYFKDLAMGRYTVQVGQASQAWQLLVHLQPSPA